MFYRIVFRRRAMRRSRPRRKPSAASRRDYALRKETARALVMSRLEHFVREYAALDPALAHALRYRRVAIRNTRSRWGSCSAAKNLNFSYRILDLAPDLQDYVIVHELCHLKELHHGRAFWDLVRRLVPDARKHARSLRKSALL